MFDDFDDDDALDDWLYLEDVDWEKVEALQSRFDEILTIEDPDERKRLAKILTRELTENTNG